MGVEDAPELGVFVGVSLCVDDSVRDAVTDSVGVTDDVTDVEGVTDTVRVRVALRVVEMVRVTDGVTEMVLDAENDSTVKMSRSAAGIVVVKSV